MTSSCAQSITEIVKKIDSGEKMPIEEIRQALAAMLEQEENEKSRPQMVIMHIQNFYNHCEITASTTESFEDVE